MQVITVDIQKEDYQNIVKHAHNRLTLELRTSWIFPANQEVQNFYSYIFENKRKILTNLLWLVVHHEAITVKVCLKQGISFEKNPHFPSSR
jgi:hypothetical protein